MKLEFDRLILPDTDIPIATKVVAVRRFRVDELGKIAGQGHPTRDAVAWFVPILWPIDLMRLPARGPRPTLSGEVPGHSPHGRCGHPLFVLPDVQWAGAVPRDIPAISAPARTSQVAQRTIPAGR
jgi:hypothetical protein